jgi:serine/threonine-protein kinase HipA
VFQDIFSIMVSKSEMVADMISCSFLNESTKRNYWQSYNLRLKKLLKS